MVITLESKLWRVRLKDLDTSWYSKRGYVYVIKYRSSAIESHIAYFTEDVKMGGHDWAERAKEVYELVKPVVCDEERIRDEIIRHLTNAAKN